jgi:hypothetical protein
MGIGRSSHPASDPERKQASADSNSRAPKLTGQNLTHFRYPRERRDVKHLQRAGRADT